MLNSTVSKTHSCIVEYFIFSHNWIIDLRTNQLYLVLLFILIYTRHPTTSYFSSIQIYIPLPFLIIQSLVHSIICLFVCSLIYLFIYSFICTFIWMFICIFICFCIFSNVYLISSIFFIIRTVSYGIYHQWTGPRRSSTRCQCIPCRHSTGQGK